MPLKTLSVDEENSISQTPQAEVYSQVEKDLKTAIDLLPVQYSSEEYGRFTRGAAKVLLSRLYLAQERWGDAATILRSVIESGIYECVCMLLFFYLLWEVMRELSIMI